MCVHCETIRRRQQEVIDAHPNGEYPGLYVTKRHEEPMTKAVAEASRENWGSPSAGLATCDCDCHAIARWFGSLPKLTPTS